MQNKIKQVKDALEKGKAMSSARQVVPSVTSNTGLTSCGTAV